MRCHCNLDEWSEYQRRASFMTCSAMWTMGLMTVTTPVKLSSPSFWRNTNQTQCLRQKLTAHITVSSRFRSCPLHVLCCWHRSLRDQIVAYLHLRIASTSVAGKQCVSPKIQYGLHNPTIVQYWKNFLPAQITDDQHWTDIKSAFIFVQIVDHFPKRRKKTRKLERNRQT